MPEFHTWAILLKTNKMKLGKSNFQFLALEGAKILLNARTPFEGISFFMNVKNVVEIYLNCIV